MSSIGEQETQASPCPATAASYMHLWKKGKKNEDKDYHWEHGQTAPTGPNFPNNYYYKLQTTYKNKAMTQGNGSWSNAGTFYSWVDTC